MAHNGCNRYLLTSIVLDSTKEFCNGQVVKRPDASILNTKLRRIIQQYQDAIDEMPYVSSFSCPELIQALQISPKQHTLTSLFDEMMDGNRAKESSKGIYKIEFKSISKLIDTSIRIEAVNHNMVSRFFRLLTSGNYSNYSARKSFSQNAYELGVNTSVIDYILGHKVGSSNTHSCLYAYIKVTPEMATEAIRKVLDNLK